MEVERKHAAMAEFGLAQSAGPKMQQVRDTLREMGLPLETVERAFQARGNGGDLNEIVAYALNLDNLQAECIEEHLSDDVVSSDEDAGSDAVDKWIQAANNMGGSGAQASTSEGNKLQPLGHNTELTAVKREEAPLEVQIEHGKDKEPQSQVECWQDPICKLFQNNMDGYSQFFDEGGSSKLKDPVEPNVESIWSVKTEDDGHSNELSQRKSIMNDPQPSKVVSGPAVISRIEQRQTSFRDMGFSTELIERAIQLHGTEADDSILLQFLLDWREHNDARKSLNKIDGDSDSDLGEDEINAIRSNVAALVTKNPKAASGSKDKHIGMGEPSWDSEDSDLVVSETDDDDEIPFRLQSPINWAAETEEFVKPAPLCRREVPGGGEHRHLMRSHGFSDDLIERAIEELGQGVEYDMLLEYLLYLASQQAPGASTSDGASRQGISTVEKLVTEFRFPAKGVEKAMKLCNTPSWNADPDQIGELVDFLVAHGGELDEEEESDPLSDSDEKAEEGVCWTWLRDQVAGDVTANRRGKRKVKDNEVEIEKVRRGRPPKAKRELAGGRLNASLGATARGDTLSAGGGREKLVRVARPRVTRGEDAEVVQKCRGSVGFGLPGTPVKPRHLSEDVKGAPFFYFENVASMPKDEWVRIRRHLFDIEPEFVDSLNFSACRRPRGYIHNLPLEGRKKIIDDPPMTIQELLPQTKAFWPVWDPRTKLNCINTQKGGEFLAKRLQITQGSALQTEHPSPEQQREILHWCRKWNLVWTTPNIPTPINEHEIELMLGFDPGHSRNCLSTTGRYKALGNSFSIFTVAYHFSVLKPLYPRGIKVLSLFSGIGGAEVALHKVGIELLVVVSVEINEGPRRCLEGWWASSKQTGILDQSFHNVKDLKRAELSDLVNRYQGFDFIVGGSPCNNLSGNNHVNRTGLDGTQSSVFFEFSRIVAAVRELTIKLQETR